eukprot:TRINITY_DN1404_c0_g3_i1.p2 TRINITY_DN1404_c0_g3~~TRINITY_DN1404_c0_g3_i1.p2  ORF type:complete len:295 (+),score=88.40 TRINITY_DN1404_c0_g3_i1:1070-1954(+)
MERATLATLAVRVRVFHECQRARNGREHVMHFDHTQRDAGVRASELLRSLRALQLTPQPFEPHVFVHASKRFESLQQLGHTRIFAELDAHHHQQQQQQHSAQPAARIDVKLVQRASAREPAAAALAPLAQRLLCDSRNTSLSSSWFGIGIMRGKSASNHGSLWRSALQFGAALTFTIGKRYQKNIEGCADIYKTHRQLPCIAYADTSAFVHNAPIDAQLVVVEYGGTELWRFEHPKRALYVLGAEDDGVPPAFVQRAHAHVSIGTARDRPSSLNVAAAGAIVMYDRMVKLRSHL